LVQAIGPFPALGLFGILLPAGMGGLALALRRLGVAAPAIVLATLLAAAVAMPYATVRPQVISWFLASVLLSILMSLGPGRQRRVVLLMPLFALWANLHGLWVVGLGVLGLYVAATYLGRTPMRGHRKWIASAAAGSVLLAAATPAGFAGLLYPLRYVDAGDWGLAHIPEWQSPNFHDAVQLPLLLWIITIAVVSRRAPGWLRVLAIGGIVMALLANRNAPMSAVLGIPAVALGADAWLRERGPATNHGVRTEVTRRVLEGGLALLTSAAVVLAIPPVYGSSGIALDRYPVAAMDVLASKRPDARVFAEYGWGGYVIYRLHDSGGSVFVDGRNDMFDQSILETYSAVRGAALGWEAVLDEYDVNAVVLPADAPLGRVLDRSPAWCVEYRDERQILALRSCDVSAFAPRSPIVQSPISGPPDRSSPESVWRERASLELD
jgi:hypothetical protein